MTVKRLQTKIMLKVLAEVIANTQQVINYVLNINHFHF